MIRIIMLWNIQIRPATPADIPQMVTLMSAQYTRKYTEGYFLWQYFQSVYPAVSMCAFEGERLIGMFGIQKRLLTNGAQVGQAIDLLIAPEWRGKGIFRTLSNHALGYFKEIDIYCSLPNPNGKNACKKTLEWTTIAKVPAMQLVDTVLHKTRSRDVHTALTVPPQVNYSVSFLYDAVVRQWRFTQHPEHHYVNISLDNSFVVTKIFTDPVSGKCYGDIVNVACDLTAETQIRTLFIQASTFLQNQHVVAVTTWAMPHTFLCHVLQDLGFKETEQERYFCIKVVNHAYQSLYDFKQWHFVQADAEIY